METLIRAWRTRREPLITDRRFDIAAMMTWFFYAAWGILSLVLSDITSFRNIDQYYPVVWGAALGVASAVATAAALTMFLLKPGSFASRIRAKRTESSALCAMLGLLAVYPTVLLLLGDPSGHPRWDILALSFSYFPFAVFRVMHLRQRISQLYRYTDRKD